MRPISEKASEILFCRHLFQAIGLRKAQIFAPTSWEERVCGYDQNIVGLSKLREINLQFKSPSFFEKWGRFSFGLNQAQSATLRRLYGEGVAFYVAHTFTSLQHANEEQISPALTEARDFLRNFICVDVHGLPSDSRSVHFVRCRGDKKPSEVMVKVNGDGGGRGAGSPVGSGHWFRADSLLNGFLAGTVGSEVNLAGDSRSWVEVVPDEQTNAAADEGLFQLAEFGVSLRLSSATSTAS